MRKLTLTIIIITSFTLYGQFVPQEDWSSSIKKQFNDLIKQNVDTLLVYYEYLGPWTNFPESCNGIYSIHILWTKDKNYYQSQIYCDSNLVSKTTNASTLPINYNITHRKNCEFDSSYFKKHKYWLPIITDVSWEVLILMTPTKNIGLGLPWYQRNKKEWKKFRWIRATIKAFDTIKSEMNIQN